MKTRHEAALGLLEDSEIAPVDLGLFTKRAGVIIAKSVTSARRNRNGAREGNWRRVRKRAAAAECLGTPACSAGRTGTTGAAPGAAGGRLHKRRKTN
jgi:hypothetical protein